ncbi:HAD-IIIC family phosphatase [Salinactinospora qingdaonensis]|uniref:N-acetyltransferase domain-containing protein n=1 Tax=Salinactinospora qingdaonensis TaxID=702744 RepID=A0ABP7EY16_9ACTN
MASGSTIKCVAWDLDGTLWDEVAIERTDSALPQPTAEVLRAIDRLAERGVVSSVASRTDPTLLTALQQRDDLASRFVAPQLAWQDKSVSLRRISEELGIGTDALALVDDDAYERAEVRAALPEALVLAPEQVAGLLDSLPADPDTLTPEARARVRRYREEEQRKQAESAFTGSREEFLAWCRMRLRLRTAEAGDVARVAELAARTHRLNSSQLAPEAEEVAAALAQPQRWHVPVAELSDRFGAYGLIGAALVQREVAAEPDAWEIRLLALSCRVAGRGVARDFVRWIMDTARQAGAARVRLVLRPTDTNTELRILLRQCGLQAGGAWDEEGRAVLRRELVEPLPAYSPWLSRDEEGRA